MSNIGYLGKLWSFVSCKNATTEGWLEKAGRIAEWGGHFDLWYDSGMKTSVPILGTEKKAASVRLWLCKD